jgi:hypothetical protein
VVVSAVDGRVTLDVPEEICLPGEGLYAGWYCGAAGRSPAAVRVGGGHIVEAHLVGPPALVGGGEAVVEFRAPLVGEGGEAVLTALSDGPR